MVLFVVELDFLNNNGYISPVSRTKKPRFCANDDFWSWHVIANIARVIIVCGTNCKAVEVDSYQCQQEINRVTVKLEFRVNYMRFGKSCL